jgi:type I restriction enzyme S subunit
MNSATLLDNFDLLAEAPGGVPKLRELILQLAVRGKLVPQDAKDEAPATLLKRLRANQQRMTKEGLLTRGGPMPPVQPEEKPHAVPHGWTWVRLGDLASPQAGFAFDSHGFNESGTGLPLIRIRDVGKLWSNTHYFGEYRKEFLVRAGDYLISMDGEFRVAVWDGPEALLNQRVTRLIFFDSLVKSRLIADALQFGLRALQGTKTYTTVDHLSGKQIASVPIPLPPLAEQKRIVARVDELMKRCDELEARQKDRDDRRTVLVSSCFHALSNPKGSMSSLALRNLGEGGILHPSTFNLLLDTPESVAELRKTILQLAVHGRLVKQDAKGEPVPVLLMAVDRERDRLRQTGTIRKDAPLRPIQQDKVPFPIPGEWEFVRLGCLMSRIGSGSTPRGGRSTYVSVGVPFLRSQNVWNDGLRLDDVAYITPETHQQMEGTHVVPGDILLNITGASLGRCAVAPPELKEANVSQHVSILRPVLPAMTPFLHLSIMSPPVQRLVWTRQVGMAREGLSKKVLELFEVPVPPLAEQKRIVAKVNELMILCDALEAKLTQSRADADTLAAAVVHRLCNQSWRANVS